MACVGIALGERVAVEPGDVVNGLANDATNVFLQQLARAAADPRTDSKEAVRRALAGERPDPARPARRDCSAGANCKVPNAGILAPPAWVRADEPAPRAAPGAAPADAASADAEGISPGETDLAQKILFSLSGDSLVMGASAALHREHPGLLRHMAVLAARVAADENRGKAGS